MWEYFVVRAGNYTESDAVCWRVSPKTCVYLRSDHDNIGWKDKEYGLSKGALSLSHSAAIQYGSRRCSQVDSRSNLVFG
jgi:hypothetical protein